MVVDRLIEASAVGGIVAMWAYFTLKTYKICKQIVFPPQFFRCEECRNHFTKEQFSSSGRCNFCEEKDILCDECSEHFLDN